MPLDGTMAGLAGMLDVLRVEMPGELLDQTGSMRYDG